MKSEFKDLVMQAFWMSFLPVIILYVVSSGHLVGVDAYVFAILFTFVWVMIGYILDRIDDMLLRLETRKDKV